MSTEMFAPKRRIRASDPEREEYGESPRCTCQQPRSHGEEQKREQLGAWIEQKLRENDKLRELAARQGKQFEPSSLSPPDK